MFRRHGERGRSKTLPFPMTRPENATVSQITDLSSPKKPSQKARFQKVVDRLKRGTK